MNFTDKVVIITGAGSGIGKVIAEEFATKGATVVVSDKFETGQEVADDIQQKGGKSIFIKCDVSLYEEVQFLHEETIRQFGRIDIGVNNAGKGPRKVVRTHEHSLEDWDSVIAVNQTGVFYGMQFQIRQMLEQGSGAIVNISSIAGLKGLPNNVAYTASKHAVLGITRTAAKEYAKKNIRINAICPGFTHTPMFDRLLETRPGLDQLFLHSIPMGKFGQPLDIANAALWLCSEQSNFITGLALPIDGGLTA